MLDMYGLITNLAKIRPVFHSEADFQHALAWEIQRSHPNQHIRLEFRAYRKYTDLEINRQAAVEGHTPMFPELFRRKMYLDVWLPKEDTAIELKYITRRSSITIENETFDLRNHGAHNQRRYDYLLDVQRLEALREIDSSVGYAILLTNEHLYWQPPEVDTIDADFRLHQGRTISGELCWRPGSEMRGRESPIRLTGSYELNWHDYSRIEARQGRFRFLVISV